MQRGTCLMLDAERQEDYVLPCCVFFFPDVCLYINHLGFIEEYRVSNEEVSVPKRPFPSHIVPLYMFVDMDHFVNSRFNIYRMLWNSKWNTVASLPASSLMVLRKYAVQIDGLRGHTSFLIANRRYEPDVPHIIVKFI